jgi:hypothetical protein
MVLQGLKPQISKRLEKFWARSVAELPSILWSLLKDRSGEPEKGE